MKETRLSYSSDIPAEPGFVLLYKHIPANTYFPLHWHDFFEFEIIVSGQGEHTYNGSVYEITAGSAYMMCYNDFHGLKANSDLYLYNVHFSKSMISPDLVNYLEFNKFCCQFSPEETQYIIQNLLRMSKEATNKLPFNDSIIKNALSDIIIYMFRKCTTRKSHATPAPIQQTIAFINENFKKNLSLNKVAEMLAFSPNYLGKLFKKETGTTLNEYVNTLRLKYACNLLTVSNLTIKEIAFSSGYSSVEYFLYIFKRKLQLTPSQYRNMTQKGLLQNN